MYWTDWELNPGPFEPKAGMLTTRPQCQSHQEVMIFMYLNCSDIINLKYTNIHEIF